MDRTQPGLKTNTLFGLSALLAFLVVSLFTYATIAPQEEYEAIQGLAALIGCVFFLVLFFRFSGIAREDGRWLLALMIVALLLRVAVSLAIYYGPIDRDIFGEDQPGYDHMPRLIVHYWNGVGARPDRLYMYPNRLGYYIFVAIQYSMLGMSLLIPRMVNCLGGALMVIYAYRLGVLVFSREVARVVAVWVSFFPSLVLWSALNLRDVWLALGILIVVYHALRLRERFSLGSLTVIFLGLVWFNFNRFYLVGVLGLIVLCILVLARSGRTFHNLVLLGVVATVMVMLHFAFGIGERNIDYLDLETVSYYRQKLGGLSTGRSGYLTEMDVTNPVVLISLVPLGLIYFLFSPFPWQVTGMRQFLTLPEMVVWYLAVPFVARAILQSLRTRARGELGLLVALGLITLAYCVGSVNMGAAYRYRAQVIVFYLLFGAAGLVRNRQRSTPGHGWGQGGRPPAFRFEPLGIPERAAGGGVDGPPVPPPSPGGVMP